MKSCIGGRHGGHAVCLWHYTYSICWGGGWEGITPQWECQLSHETCSVTDWRIKQTDETLEALSVKHDLWPTLNTFLPQKQQMTRQTLTFDLKPRECLELADCSFFMKSGLLLDFMISKNTIKTLLLTLPSGGEAVILKQFFLTLPRGRHIFLRKDKDSNTMLKTFRGLKAFFPQFKPTAIQKETIPGWHQWWLDG